MSFSRLWMGLIPFFIITLSVIISPVQAQTNVIYVDVNSFCFTPCNGSSWELAYKNLPDAVAAANASSMVKPDIWVADYFLKYELANPINLVNANVGNIYGGFSGYGRSGRGNDETSVDQRNPDLYPVILTGDLALDNDPVGDTLTSFFIIGGNTDVGIYDIDLEFAKSDAILMSSGGLTLNNVSISNADGSGINITGVGTGNNVGEILVGKFPT